jgi:type I restriction enzyme S subunit
MKQGWEINKLGEVCKNVSNINWKKISIDTEYPYIDLSAVDRDSSNICDYEYVNKDNAPSRAKQVVNTGDVIFATTRPLLKRVCVITELFNNAIASTGFCVLRPTEKVISKWIYYKLKSDSFYKYIEPLQKGISYPAISDNEVKNFILPIPPREEQERIVAELDCLNGVIEKKKQQLKELDALAQSIFYQMFGDPITNEKGWETCELQKVSTLLNGRAYKQNELLDEGKYKVLRVGNFFTNSNYYYSDLELEPEKYCDDGDLLFAWSASFGAFIWNGGKVIYHYHIWKVLYDKQKLNIDYYRFLLNTMTAYFMKDVHGIGMVHLTKAGMEQYILPVPPLALQQEFAEKIEKIEQQKKLISQSIKEVEDLFNSRMDYYFN